MNIALWIVQVLLPAAFIFAGVNKAFRYEYAHATLPWVKDVLRGMTTFIGVAELLGGLGLLLPALTGMLPWLTPLAATGPGHAPGDRLQHRAAAAGRLRRLRALPDRAALAGRHRTARSPGATAACKRRAGVPTRNI
jgi:hypothetical protein